jgi:rubrerythrin
MQKFSIREVVEMAIQTERAGYIYYEKISGNFSHNEDLTRLFGILAQQERKHEMEFEKLLSEIDDEDPVGWEDVQNYFRAMMESEFFLGSGKSLPELDNIRTVRDALDFAIGFEKESILYYVGLKSVVNDKEIIDEIIKEETSHVLWLSNLKETITG